MKILTSKEVEQALYDMGCPWGNIYVPDQRYVMPAWAWVNLSFSMALEKLQDAFVIRRWMSTENDCDDFARVSAAFAQVLHVNTPNHPPDTALAFGEFWYTRDMGGGHAVNVVFTGEKEVKFYEPQTRQFVNLSKREIESAMIVRM